MNEEQRRIKFPAQFGVQKIVSKDRVTKVILPDPAPRPRILEKAQIAIEEQLLYTAVKVVDNLLEIRIKEIREAGTKVSIDWTDDIITRIITEVTQGVLKNLGNINIINSTIETEAASKDDSFHTIEMPELNINRAKGHELVGSIGEEVFSNPQYTKDILKALEAIEQRNKK